ncbi:hypothetical protein SORBI_3002G100950 [Sorghum bicolor]|uniref:Uncharacterized protein n=1 Tax=Sorghum bicolor TaxID=4558 RepID=A0A1W0W372_SORBI|nr:hypothetical protein SORBI_3002G100950 [Sorghum bicolor]
MEQEVESSTGYPSLWEAYNLLLQPLVVQPPYMVSSMPES